MKKRVTIKSNTFVLLIVAFCLLAAIAKVIYVAVAPKIDGVDLKKFASNRNTKTKVLYASRGTIFDSNGEALALSVNSYKLLAYLSPSRTTNENNPKHVVDKEYTAKMIAPIIGEDESKILEYLNKDVYQTEFGKKGRNLTESVKSKIEELNLPGITFIEGTQRYYKMSDFASYIIGYAKTSDEGEIKGELGIESYFDEELSGKNGSLKYESDAKGHKLPNAQEVKVEAENGQDIYLTLDSNIQLITENAIKGLEENYNFEFAIMSVMDAKTGAIVASATSPSYNPNKLSTLKSYLNPLVSYTFEPGSTMKTFAWASAIEEGIYDGNKLYESGQIPVADVVIKDFNKVGWGKISYDTGYAYSSNVAATKLALELGITKLTNYYEKFGFGKKTGIELSGEVKGELDITYKSELASASFGQGMTVTPIQLLQAYTSIVNDGVMLKPYIVKKIVNKEGKVSYERKPEEIGTVMKKETAQKMRELMHKVNYEGLSKSWQPSTVNMMIKTGTSQIAVAGGYMKGDYNSIYSVAGIFPEEEPKYIIYVAVSKIEGTQKAVANMTTKAVDEIAAYADLTSKKEETIKDSTIIVDNYISSSTESAQIDLMKNNVNAIVIGNGKYIINQFPQKGSKIVGGSKVFLLTNTYEFLMPNMSGWSLSEVRTYFKLTGLNFSYNGFGYVCNQSVGEGTPLSSDMIVNLELS